MNHKPDDIRCFDDPALEREWQAQEDAMRRERLHLYSDDDNAEVLRYRLIARVLAMPPPDEPPPDFAQKVARLAIAIPASRPHAVTFETVLTIVLAVALFLSASTITALHGARWWSAFGALLPSPLTVHWLLALLGCVCLTWLVSKGSQLMADLRNP